MLLALGIVGFIAVQVGGTVPLFARAAAKVGKDDRWHRLVRDAADLKEAIRAIYRRWIRSFEEEDADRLLRIKRRAEGSKS